MVDDAEEVLLGEPSREERVVGGVHEEGFLRDLGDDVFHGGLHGFLDVAEVDGLAQADEESGGHELENLDGFLGFARGHEPQRVHVLVVLLCALDVGGDGVGEVVELAEVGRHGDLCALHAVVQAGVWPPGEVRGKAVVVKVVHELAELRKHELPDGGDGEPHVVHGHADWGPLEVPPVDRPVARGVNQGVVVHRVDLALDRMCGCSDYLDLGSQPLRGSPKRVPILLRLLQRIGLVQLRGGLHV